MKRVIVDYAKLTNEILTLLVERFPEGYDDSNIIRFKNAKNETIEAVEVKTEDTIYLVKVSTKLADRIENFDEDDMDPTDDIDTLKDLDIADDEAEDEVEETEDRPDVDDEDEDGDGDDRDVEDTEYSDDEEDED